LPRLYDGSGYGTTTGNTGYEYYWWGCCLFNATKDSPNQITAMVAMAIMFEMISLIADRHHSS
jgi:hypothetical protein